MSFRHISKVLADVMAEVETKRAEAAICPAEFEGGLAQPGGAEASPPNARPVRGARRERMPDGRGATAGNGVAGKGGDPHQPGSRDMRQTTGCLEDMTIVASLPVGRSMAAVSAASKGRSPALAAVIDLAIWRKAHQASTSALSR